MRYWRYQHLSAVVKRQEAAIEKVVNVRRKQ